MNEFHQAADDANRLLRGFAGVQTLADSFAKVGGLQQAADEAQARLKALQADVEKAKGELATADQELASARADTAAEKKKAADIAEAAGAFGTQAMADAQREADALVAAAKVDANGVLAEASAKVTEANLRCNKLAEEADVLEERIAQAKAQMAKLLG